MKYLTSKQEFDQLMTESHQTPQVIFKHSLLCPVSRAAHERLASIIEEPSFHILIIQDSAALKMIVAGVLNVDHESPQVIIVMNGEVVYTTSHQAITLPETQKVLDEYKK